MDTKKVKKFAIIFLKKHNLKNWSIKFFKPEGELKNALGQCCHSEKIIKISINNTKKTIKDTILHEIAHALTPKENHNLIWQLKAFRIGANSDYVIDSVASKMVEHLIIKQLSK
jgi:hypothetical protein